MTWRFLAPHCELIVVDINISKSKYLENGTFRLYKNTPEQLCNNI